MGQIAASVAVHLRAGHSAAPWWHLRRRTWTRFVGKWQCLLLEYASLEGERASRAASSGRRRIAGRFLRVLIHSVSVPGEGEVRSLLVIGSI